MSKQTPFKLAYLSCQSAKLALKLPIILAQFAELIAMFHAQFVYGLLRPPFRFPCAEEHKGHQDHKNAANC